MVLWVVVLVSAAVTLRVVAAGEEEIAASTAALEAGDAQGAAFHARNAALWYAPGAPHVRVAYGRLLALAREAERQRKAEIALMSYRAILTANTSTRWLLEPAAAEAEEARRSIARIDSKSGERPPGIATDPAAEVETAQLKALAVTYAPRPAWILVLALSFLVLLGGLALVVARAFDETGRIDWARARLPCVIAAIGLMGYGAALFAA